jgi:hypothetical protein
MIQAGVRMNIVGYPKEGAIGAKQHTIRVDDKISITQWGNKPTSVLQ